MRLLTFASLLYEQIKNMSYYDPLADSWTKIGDLPKGINTPVCDFSLRINGHDWMYCESGDPHTKFSFKRKIKTGV